MSDHDQPQDVVVAGGAYVGLTLALALKRGAPQLSVTVVDATPPATIGRDGRASAIAASARHMLEALDIWPVIAGEAQPIEDMVVTDSRTADAVRPVFLTFPRPEGSDPFAHMVPNGRMVAALRTACDSAGVSLRAPESVTDFTCDSTGVTVSLASGGRIAARLLVAADGARSRLRRLAGIKTIDWSYGQSGIVTTVAHERPHNGRAEEHFLPGGPFAILPLTGNRASLVWTEPTRAAEALVAGSDEAFATALEQRFGHHLGPLKVVGPRHAYPLGLSLARNLAGPRLALVGDAAHVVHPIAGQGLNLGLKDVAALAETVVEAARLGLDIGNPEVLARYERWRRADTVEMALVTDGLNRLFSNDVAPLRIVRDIGLGLVDRMPKLKDFFIGRAAGTGADLPRLLRGEPL